MDRRVRDSVNYNRDYQQFIQNLQKFHGSRGSGFKRVPFFGGKELDLYLLYKTVTSLGGCAKVTDEKKWREVAKCFNLPASCTNAAFSLRQYYLRYLASYERLHFLGEDGDDASLDLRRSISSSFFQSSISFVPNTIQESAKKMVPGPLGEPKVHNFDRLIFSLMSGLPNEVDFALNICTLLSNVTNSIFNLAKAPTIIDLMLAHVGIFTEGKVSMRELYKEWYQESDRDFDKFWRESIDDEAVKEIYSSYCGGVESEASNSLSNPFNNRSCRLSESVEAKRVNQICVILHNFSYEELNCLFISTHSNCIRFLILCAGSRLLSLRKMALDALDNVADKITLSIVQDEMTQSQLRVIHSFLFSKDRTRKVRAISILAKLCGQQENEDVLSEAVPQDVYDELIKCLTIPDIQLILNSLDALYFLSDLGEATATAIVMVNRSIDILVCLVTVHAESYGNRAISGFRIVENKNSVYAQKQNIAQQNQNRKNALQQMQRSYAQLHPVAQQQIAAHHQARASPKTQIPTTSYSAVRPDAQKPDENEEVEPEIFAARWISAFYELAPGNEIKRSQVFADYIESCKDLGRKGVLNVQSFFKILGLVIPAPYWRLSENSDPSIVGIKRRTNPLIVKNKSARPLVRVPDVTPTHNEQTVPVRPIPVMPTITSQSQVSQRLPFTSQQSPQTSVSNSASLYPGQMQSTRADLPAHSDSSVPTTGVPVPIGSSGLPLKLLEEHVNSQGQAKECSTSVTPVKPMVNACVTTADPSSQQHQPQAYAQLSKQPLAQVSGISQTEAVNTLPGQQVLGNMAQIQQTVLLQSNATSIGTGTSDANSTLIQSSLDPNAKLSSQQKLSAKERNERKKAVKAAREMINADIKASNLDPLTQCQNLTERIQKEMQQHFVQFHIHQQSIQAIQAQLQQIVLQNQQPKLPQNVMEDIQTRVRNHHTQMQTHYAKLQQLQILLQQVKVRIAQEQKEQPVASQDGAVGANEQALRKTPRAPRILRKQTAPSTSSFTNDITLTHDRPHTVLPASINIGPIPQVSTVVAPGTTQLMTQATALPSMQTNRSTTLTNTSLALPTHGSVRTDVTTSTFAVVGSNAKGGETVQTTGAPTQITFFSNSTQLQTQVPGIQLSRTAFKPPSKHTGTPVLQKPVSITYNTPILPRPPTSAFQTPIPPNVPNSAKVGQTVLFTMPVVALPQQGAVQYQTPSSASLVDTAVHNNTRVLSNLSAVENESATGKEQLGRSDDLGNDAGLHAKSAEDVSTAADLNTAEPVEGTAHSSALQGVVAPSFLMTSAHSQNIVSNGPIKTFSPVIVNGGIENAVGKGHKKCTGTDSVVDGIPNATQNGQVNGTSGEDESLSSSSASERAFEQTDGKDTTLQSHSVTVDRSRLVNGDCVGSGMNGRTELEDKLTELNHKRKLGEVRSDRKNIGDVLDNDDILIDKYDSVVKGNKKVKLNGIYMNSLRERDEGNKVGDIDMGNRESCRGDTEQPRNGLNSESENRDNKTVDTISCEITGITEKCERDPESEVKDESTNVASKNTEENDQISRTDQDDQKGEDNSDKQQNRDNVNCEKKTFSCQWTGCKGSFSCTSDLLAHMVLSHAPQEGSLKVCKVSGCKPVQRPRGSMICHFSQVHCNRSNSSENEQVTLPQLLFPKVVDIEREDESPVTRSVRLTAALVLRNIARNSAFGRKIILNYESRLSPAAMSSSEASSAVAACLEELTKKRRKSSDFAEEDNAS